MPAASSAVGDRVVDEREQGVGIPSVRARLPPLDRKHLAREVGGDHEHLVRADVDAQHVADAAREAQEARPPPRPARGGELCALVQVALLEQKLDREVDRGLRKAGRARDLGPRNGPVGANCAQHCGRVEPTKEAGGAGWRSLVH